MEEEASNVSAVSGCKAGFRARRHSRGTLHQDGLESMEILAEAAGWLDHRASVMLVLARVVEEAEVMDAVHLAPSPI